MKAALMTARILWAALLTSTVLYLVVLQLLPPRPSQQVAMLPPILGAVACTLLVLSFILPASLRKTAYGRAGLQVKEEVDPNAEVLFRSAPPKRRVFADRERATRVARMSYQTAFILSLALAEAIAILGFLLAFLGHPYSIAAPFFVVCWIAMLARFPTERAVVGPLERHYDAKLV